MEKNKTQLAAILLGLVVMVLFFRGTEKERLSSPEGSKNVGAKAVTGDASTARGTLHLLEVRGQRSLKALETRTAFLKDLAMIKSGMVKARANATFSATLVGGTYYNCWVDFPDQSGDKEFYIVNTVTWQFEYASASSTTYAGFYYTKPSVSSTYRVYCNGEYTNELTL